MRDRRGPVLAIVLAVTACQVEEVGVPGPSEGQEAPPPEKDKIILNGLPVAVLEAGLPALIEEARGPLTGEVITATAEGRELLAYVARCALDWDQAVVAAGGPYHGQVGLTPDWLDRALTPEEGRWLTACVIASLNTNGVHVPMSVRGPREDLVPSPSVSNVYHLQEAAFFGDFFRPVQDRFVCIGEAFRSDALTDPESWYRMRLCSWQESCDIQQSGFCDGLCDQALGEWTECNSWEDFDVATGQWRRYREVLTVYLPDRME